LIKVLAFIVLTMSTLTAATRRRLLQLRQTPSVWEGDRRAIAPDLPVSEEWADASPDGLFANGTCVLWVDGSQGIVRSMDIVSPESGTEAVVRTLIRAMEYPQGSCAPGRPQKIVVRDRELQFFLRGVLQDLEIAVECVPSLPLIDEIFKNFQQAVHSKPPKLPPDLMKTLTRKADEVWKLTPWDLLEDHQILSVELNQWDLSTLYVSVMGMLGMEYGLLLYRSLDSLKRFRSIVVSEQSPEKLEEAFLSQDCFYLTFQCEDLDEDDEIDLMDVDPNDIESVFGNLHPLEGMRPFLCHEEALAMFVSIEAIIKFFRQHRRKLTNGRFPALSSEYAIPLPANTEPSSIAARVATLPDLATELLEMMDDDEDDSALTDVKVLKDDLVPDGSICSVGAIPWEALAIVRQQAEVYQAASTSFLSEGDGLPVFLVQTSRPKAKTLIDRLQQMGGLQGLGFNSGENPMLDEVYDLGFLQTVNGDLHLCGEFLADDPNHVNARKKWERRCKKTQGYCGLVIARGSTGASRGQPQLKDMVALYEVPLVSPEELGLGMLQLMPRFNFDIE
jgi:hypothetical protein